MRVSVVVPSYGRSDSLRRCLRALERQTVEPAETIVAGRSRDDATAEAAAEAGARFVEVTGPGHLPPLLAGARAAGADVVAFVDDDAEPWPGWVRALARHYRRPAVGGVGGLVAQPGASERAVGDRIGVIGATGRFDALHTERVPRHWGPRSVHVLRGTNMSFRRELLLDYPWDARLNAGAATDYEVDLCAWVRRQGYDLVYDPDAAVTHYQAARPDLDRTKTPRAIRDYSHNLVYVSGKALPFPRAALAIAQAFVVGNRHSYGLVTALADVLLGRSSSVVHEIAPAFGGKLAGLRSLREYRRSGPSPLL